MINTQLKRSYEIGVIAIAIILLLTHTSCTNEESEYLDGVWYMELEANAAIPLDWEEEIGIPATEEEQVAMLKKAPGFSYHHPFNFIEIQGDSGLWNPGSLFYEGWGFTVNKRAKQVILYSPHSADTLRYEIHQDTLYLIQSREFGMPDRVMYKGIRRNKDQRDTLREFLASAPLRKEVKLPKMDSALLKVTYVPDENDFLVFYGKFKVDYIDCLNANHFISSNGHVMLVDGLSLASDYLRDRGARVGLLTSEENLEECLNLLEGSEVVSDLLVCFEKEGASGIACVPMPEVW